MRARSCSRERHFHALHFRGPGTDLTVGLSDGHQWLGGSKPAKNGIECNPNIPTEEVFTTPHKDRVDGTVRSTKPLSYQGTLIEGIGCASKRAASSRRAPARGEEVLQRVLDTDDGARRLGEVALVPNSSPISQSGLLFQNTLFDENAASHIALGQAYSTALAGSDGLDEAGLAARGANRSLIHIDWMIGSGEVDVDGLRGRTAARSPVMRARRVGFVAVADRRAPRRCQPGDFGGRLSDHSVHRDHFRQHCRRAPDAGAAPRRSAASWSAASPSFSREVLDIESTRSTISSAVHACARSTTAISSSSLNALSSSTASWRTQSGAAPVAAGDRR